MIAMTPYILIKIAGVLTLVALLVSWLAHQAAADLRAYRKELEARRDEARWNTPVLFTEPRQRVAHSHWHRAKGIGRQQAKANTVPVIDEEARL